MQLGPKVNNVTRVGLVNMGRTVNILRNIYFDPRQFQTTNVGNGLNVTYIGQTGQTGDTFPWDKILFGYKIDGNKFTVLAGEIHFAKRIINCAETELTIADDNDYVYVSMELGSGICSINQSTTYSDTTTTDTTYKKWLYLLKYTAPLSVSVTKYGHIGGAIDIMPLFANVGPYTP